MILISNPKAALMHPIDYSCAIIAYVFIYSLLFGVTITLRICHLNAGMYFLLKSAWINDRFFHQRKDDLDAARKALGGKLQGQDTTLERTHKFYSSLELHFNPEVARVILLLSTILYEPDISRIKHAFNYPNGEPQYWLSSEREDGIYKLAASLRCGFVSITDWGHVDFSTARYPAVEFARGPSAGVFYDTETSPMGVPFIIIVFNGTSARSSKEWILDASFNLKVTAPGPPLGEGYAHQGFYSSLFGLGNEGLPSLHSRILGTINAIANQNSEKQKKITNLFVGGHSLGAGMASLFYASLLEHPEALGKNVCLRDAYCFGTPRAFGGSLASRFEYNLSKPVNHHRALWRIINQSSFPILPGDVVTRIPPGMADARKVRSDLREGSLLSYSSVGISVTMLPDEKPQPVFSFGAIPAGYKVLVEDETSNSVGEPQANSAMFTRGDDILRSYFTIFHDHFPASYLQSLDRISMGKR